MKLTARIEQSTDKFTLFKNSSFLNSTVGTLFRGIRLRDLREFVVGILTPKVSYDRNVWKAKLYRPITTFGKTVLSKLGICQNPGPEVELFPEAVDPTAQEARALLAPAKFATHFSVSTHEKMQEELESLQKQLDNDSLEFLSEDSSSEKAKEVYEKLPGWMKKSILDGVFNDPATGNVIALIWDERNQNLHTSFCGTSTLNKEPDVGSRLVNGQIATDIASYAGLHIPSSHKQAADVIGACKSAMEEAAPDHELQCYGFSLGGGLALYAGTKHGVKTYTVNGISINWRMQCDLGEARMNHMVREDLLTNISIEGDEWSDPIAGRYSGVCKAASVLEQLPLVGYPRPRKFGKTYRIKWKEEKDSYVEFMKAKYDPKGKKSEAKYATKVTGLNYRHCCAPDFVAWRMNKANRQTANVFSSDDKYNEMWNHVKAEVYSGQDDTDLDDLIQDNERERIQQGIHEEIVSFGKKFNRDITADEAVSLGKTLIKDILAKNISRYRQAKVDTFSYSDLSEEMRLKVEQFPNESLPKK